MKMKNRVTLLITLLLPLITFPSCTDVWENHYDEKGKSLTTESNMWTNLSQWRSIYFTYSGHYSYKSKYALDITARLDGSTKFGADNRWGFFPAISGRWNISDESWMQWSRPWLSMLSIRPGWGQVGQQPGAQYLHFSRYGRDTQYMDMPAVRPNNVRLTDLRWETKTTWNIGTDIGLWDDLITMDINVYDQLTDNLLMRDVRIPTSTGFSSLAWKNVGSDGGGGV